MNAGTPDVPRLMELDALLATAISLKRLTVREVTVPRKHGFRSAIGERTARRALILRWTDGDGAWGLGECSCRPDPFFNGEFVDGAVAVLRDFVFPRLPARGTVRDVVAVATTIRGWPFTTAALLDALFDLLRREGLADPWDQWTPPPLPRVPTGISLPIFDTAEEATIRVGQAVEAGFRRVKLKVMPGMDTAVLHAVREAFPAIPLGFDANGSVSERDLAFLQALAAFEPVTLEQPFAPDRLDLCEFLKAFYPSLPLCLDESITSLGALMTAHRLGALDELNLKPGRVGGALEAARILAYCRAHGLPAWVGGMFETGIGRAANLRVAACLPEAAAHDLSPPSFYLTEDVVQAPLTMDADGFVAYDGRPVTPDEAALDRLTTQQVVLTKG